MARMVTDHWPSLVTHSMVKATAGKMLEKTDVSIGIKAGDLVLSCWVLPLFWFLRQGV